MGKAILTNEAFLEEKLGALESAHKWSPRVLSKLEATIYSEVEKDLYRINPLRFAAAKNIEESECIDLFLLATHHELFVMNWNLLCPSCGDHVKSFASLKNLKASYFCCLCHRDTVANFDDYIQISFTINPRIREIAFHHPDKLSVEDYYFIYRYGEEGIIRGLNPKLSFRDYIKANNLFLHLIAPGESVLAELQISDGYFVCHNLHGDFGSMFTVSNEKGKGTQTLELTMHGDRSVPLEGTLKSGALKITFKNVSDKLASVAVLNPPADQKSDLLEFDPFLTGKRLLTNQTFLDLFQYETLGGNEGIGVKDLTFLFTDLKGSTALYERLGDFKAYNLVRQHFKSLGKVIVQNSGAIVKTIGDAVMATFMDPAASVSAALQMLAEIKDFNRKLTSNDIILKIGIHHGPSIAVTLNERLDYFGQTVNIAARVQGLANAEEIYMTEDVFRAPGVGDVVKAYNVEKVKANLRGIESKWDVFRISKT